MPGRLEVRFNDSRAVEPESLVDTEFNQITADYFDTFDIPSALGVSLPVPKPWLERQWR